MSSYCPVCNGLQTLEVQCPGCYVQAADYGRFNDYLGPYSPYRPIDDISMSNGYDDLKNHLCLHLMNCPKCNRTFQSAVQEIH